MAAAASRCGALWRGAARAQAARHLVRRRTAAMFAASMMSALKRSGRIAAAAAALAAVPVAAAAFAYPAVAATSPAPAAAPAAIPFTGLPGTPHERTFIAIKPDGVHRGIVGEIVTRFERKGYKLVAVKFLKPTKAQAEEHYADLSKKPFFGGLTDFFSSGPIVAMVWEGQGAIKGIRQMMGTTNPVDSLPGSIRGDYCIITGRNIIHGSDGPESARAEITHWFKPEELVDWTPTATSWVYESK